MFERFDFINFEPTKSLQDYACIKLNRIMEHAPDGATSAAFIEKIGSGYRCHIDIVSEAGIFSAEALANDSLRAIDRLEHRIDHKFGPWLHRRFAS